MSETTLQSGTTRILYDGTLLSAGQENWLFPDYWQANNAIIATHAGRGTAWRVETPAGLALLRRFRRGGLVGYFNDDRYLYTGLARSRAFLEWRLLRALYERGLPVPRPLAASCERHGLWYRAGLLTVYIPGTQTLADRLETGSVAQEHWHVAGKTIRRFHDAGVEHADLNARNILLDGAGRVYLIDFDRGCLVRPEAVHRERMLARLRRSLDKIGVEAADAGWKALMAAYATTNDE